MREDIEIDEMVLPVPDSSDEESSIEPVASLQSVQVAGVDLHLQHDKTEGCGGMVWESGKVLTRYITKKKLTSYENTTVLELGAGTGIVGLALSKLVPSSKVYITDIPQIVPLIEKGIRINELTNAIPETLVWGERLPALDSGPSVLLLADCVYYEPSFQPLVDTLVELTDRFTINEILFAYKKRRRADKHFFKMLAKRFKYSQVTDDPDAESYNRDNISLFILKRRM